MSHINLWWWLSDTTEIIQSVDKTFFTLRDGHKNDVVIYDDVQERLFNTFVEIVPKRIHPRALRVVRLGAAKDAEEIIEGCPHE